jgi:hypothetical protein
MVAYFAANRVGAQTSNPSFAITISSRTTTFESGSPIRLDITIENHLNQVLLLGSTRTVDGARSGIIILRSDGSRVEPIHQPQPGDIKSGMGIGLEPHKGGTESLNLGRFFDLTKPGQYSVQVKKRDPQNNLDVGSNLLTITITP